MPTSVSAAMPNVHALRARTLRVSSVVFAITGLAACYWSPKLSRAPQGALVAEEVPGLGEPRVVVDNHTDVTLTLKLSGAASRRLEVPAHHQRTIRMKPGSYAYEATALLTPPAAGEARFLTDHRYTWSFAIIRRPDDDPRLAGTGFHCFNPEHELPFETCYRTKEVCEATAKRFFVAAPQAECQRSGELCGAGLQKPIVGEWLGTCTPFPRVYRFADPKKDVALSAPTFAQCESMRAIYLRMPDVDSTSLLPCAETK
jgi:hypothetical protein